MQPIIKEITEKIVIKREALTVRDLYACSINISSDNYLLNQHIIKVDTKYGIKNVISYDLNHIQFRKWLRLGYKGNIPYQVVWDLIWLIAGKKSTNLKIAPIEYQRYVKQKVEDRLVNIVDIKEKINNSKENYVINDTQNNKKYIFRK